MPSLGRKISYKCSGRNKGQIVAAKTGVLIWTKGKKRFLWSLLEGVLEWTLWFCEKRTSPVLFLFYYFIVKRPSPIKFPVKTSATESVLLLNEHLGRLIGHLRYVSFWIVNAFGIYSKLILMTTKQGEFYSRFLNLLVHTILR